MKYTATALRKQIYKILDSVIDTGIPVEIERRGRSLRIVSDQKVSRLQRLQPHQIVQGDSDNLPDLHWDQTWSGWDENIK